MSCEEAAVPGADLARRRRPWDRSRGRDRSGRSGSRRSCVGPRSSRRQNVGGRLGARGTGSRCRRWRWARGARSSPVSFGAAVYREVPGSEREAGRPHVRPHLPMWARHSSRDPVVPASRQPLGSDGRRARSSTAARRSPPPRTAPACSCVSASMRLLGYPRPAPDAGRLPRRRRWPRSRARDGGPGASSASALTASSRTRRRRASAGGTVTSKLSSSRARPSPSPFRNASLRVQVEKNAARRSRRARRRSASSSSSDKQVAARASTPSNGSRERSTSTPTSRPRAIASRPRLAEWARLNRTSGWADQPRLAPGFARPGRSAAGDLREVWPQDPPQGPVGRDVAAAIAVEGEARRAIPLLGGEVEAEVDGEGVAHVEGEPPDVHLVFTERWHVRDRPGVFFHVRSRLGRGGRADGPRAGTGSPRTRGTRRTAGRSGPLRS